MRIFFRFGNSELFFAMFTQHFAQCILKIVFAKDHMDIFKGAVVIGHGDILQIHFMHILLGKILLTQGHGNLTPAIGSEIKTHHNIAFPDGSQWCTVAF